MVSVIIPTYNRENTIKASIESVLSSTYDNFEIIVVDDGSTDGTEDILKPLLSDKLRYVKNKNNVGIAGARNVGIDHARGEYVAFNDSDDYWRPTKLEKQMEMMQQHPEYLLLYCAFERTNKDGTKVIIPSKNRKLKGNVFEQLLIGNVISTQTMLFRKECFEKVGKFNTDIKTLDDYEMALKVAKISEIGYVDEVLVDVVMSADSVTDPSKNFNKKFDDYMILLKKYYSPKEYKICKSFTNSIIRLCCYMTKEEFNNVKKEFDFFEEKRNLYKLFFEGMYELRIGKNNRKRIISIFTSKDKIKNFNIYSSVICSFVCYCQIRIKKFIMNRLKLNITNI